MKLIVLIVCTLLVAHVCMAQNLITQPACSPGLSVSPSVAGIYVGSTSNVPLTTTAANVANLIVTCTSSSTLIATVLKSPLIFPPQTVGVNFPMSGFVAIQGIANGQTTVTCVVTAPAALPFKGGESVSITVNVSAFGTSLTSTASSMSIVGTGVAGTTRFGLSLSQQPTQSVTVACALTETDSTITIGSGVNPQFSTINYSVVQYLDVVRNTGISTSTCRYINCSPTSAVGSYSAANNQYIRMNITSAQLVINGVTSAVAALTKFRAGTTSGSFSISIQLSSLPYSSVVVRCYTSDATIAVVNNRDLIFSTTNWSVAQTYSFTAVSAGQTTITCSPSTTTGGYYALNTFTLPVCVDLSIANNLILTSFQAPLIGSSSGTIWLRLNSAPTSNINVQCVSSQGTSQNGASETGTVSFQNNGQLTFTPDNWIVEQSMLVSGSSAGVATVTCSVVTVGGGYSACQSRAFKVNVVNSSIAASVSTFTVTSSSSATSTIALSAAPSFTDNSSTVTVRCTSNAPNTAVVGGSTATSGLTSTDFQFTRANFYVGQVLKVFGLSTYGSTSISCAVLSSAGGYSTSVSTSISVCNIISGGAITASSTSVIVSGTTIAANGVAAQASIGLSLSTAPSASVTVTCTSNSAAVVLSSTTTGVTSSSWSSTYTSANYNTPQMLYVQGTSYAVSATISCVTNTAGGYAGSSCGSAAITVKTSRVVGATVNAVCSGTACLNVASLAIADPVICDNTNKVSLTLNAGQACISLGVAPMVGSTVTVTCSVLPATSLSYGSVSGNVLSLSYGGSAYSSSVSLTFNLNNYNVPQTINVRRNVATYESSVTCVADNTGLSGYGGNMVTIQVSNNSLVNFSSSSQLAASIVTIVLVTILGLLRQ